MNPLLCTAINAMLTLSSPNGDTVGVAVRVHERWGVQQQLMGAAYTSPALLPLRYRHGISELSLQATSSKASASAEPQLGLGEQNVAVRGQSHGRLRNGATVWGNALYQSGLRRNVRWNETADYQRLRPYVCADTLGGNLHSEQYQFDGGTAFGIGQWTLGGTLGFSALHEHRRIDPRPRNRYGTMLLHIAVARNVGSRYAVSIDVAATKYKQRGSIGYYNELGVSTTHHLQGLGLGHARFDGNNTSTSYSGHQLEAGLGLAPTTANGGLTLALRTSTEHYDKVLLNVNDLTLNELRVSQHTAEVGWLQNAQHATAGLLLRAQLSTRTGSEIIYGDAANNEYPRLSTAIQYSEHKLQTNVCWLYERTTSQRWQWHVLPGAGYAQTEEKHLSPLNTMSYSHLLAKLALGSTWKAGKVLILMRIESAYHHRLRAEQHLSHTVNAYAQRIEEERFDMYQSNLLDLRALTRLAFPIGAQLLHIDIGAQHLAYNNGHKNWKYSLNIGLCI